MQNKKILSVLTSLALTISLTAPTLATGEYLSDVENIFAVSVPGGVEISWDAVEHATGYTIYYGIESVGEDGGSYESNIAVGEVTEYIVKDLLVDTIYYFSIGADDSTGIYQGSYNYSEEASAIAGEEITLPDPDPIPDPDPDPIPDPDPDPDEDLPIVDPDEINPDLDPDPNPALPDSGPATAAIVFVSAAGAYFYQRFQK